MKKKAFVFGSNTFGLKYAERDVSLISQTLLNYGYEIVTPKLSRLNLIEEFDNFIDDSDKLDLLILYFSGHAVLNKGDLHLVISEGDLDKRKNTIQLKYFTEGFQYCRASEKLVILDCCNANASTDEWRLEQSDRYRILTASEKLEKAKEVDSYQASYLTYQLSKALIEKPGNIVFDNKIYINHLYDWMITSTSEYNRINSYSPVPLPNLLGNQKSNFELANITQIEASKTGITEELSSKEIGKIVEKTIEENEKLYFIEELDLESLYDKNVKLYNHIFKVFLDKLSKVPHLKSQQPYILFNRILSFKKLEELDILTISRIRVDDNFLWYERSLIISALSLSLLNKLDGIKLGLLIDFLSDFEPKVWERALVGLILSLKDKDKLIKSYETAFRRLKNLQFTPEILRAIEIIIFILRNESYSFKRQIEKEGIENCIKRVQPFFKFLAFKDKKYSLSEEEEIKFNKEVENSILTLAKNELNILGIEYEKESDFFRKPQHWFLPFYPNNPLIKEKLKDENLNIDLDTFLIAINDNLLIDDSDKYYLCLSSKEISEEDLNFLNLFGSKKGLTEMMNFIGGSGLRLPYDPEKLIFYTLRVREYYKYINLFSEAKLKEDFSKRYDIYSSSLIEVISSEWHRLKILGDEEKNEGFQFEAIQYYLKALEYDEKNVEVLIPTANCLYELGLRTEALNIYLMANELSPANPELVKKIALCYFMANDYFNAWKYSLITNRLLPKDLDSLKFIAFYHYINKDYDLAKRFYLEAYKLNQNDFFIAKKIGEINQILGKYDESISFFLEARKINVVEYKFLLNLGDCYFYTKNYKYALKAYLDYEGSTIIHEDKSKAKARIKELITCMIDQGIPLSNPIL